MNNPLSGADSSIPAGVGSVKNQQFLSDTPSKSLFGVKGVKLEISPFDGKTRVWRPALRLNFGCRFGIFDGTQSQFLAVTNKEYMLPTG